MAALVELERQLVRAAQLQAVEGGVAHAGVGVSGEHAAGGDVAPAVACRVPEDRELRAQVHLRPQAHHLLHRAGGDGGARQGVGEAALHRRPYTVHVQAEHGRDVRGAGEAVSGDGHGVASHVGEVEGEVAVVAVDEAGEFQVRVDAAAHLEQPPGGIEAREGGAEAGVEHGARVHGRPLRR